MSGGGEKPNRALPIFEPTALGPSKTPKFQFILQKTSNCGTTTT
jgi:hypothetical protein